MGVDHVMHRIQLLALLCQNFADGSGCDVHGNPVHVTVLGPRGDCVEMNRSSEHNGIHVVFAPVAR